MSSTSSTTTVALSAIEKARARLLEIKAAAEKKKVAVERQLLAANTLVVPSLSSNGWSIDNSVPWNDRQLDAINLGLARKSFCLIGAAGTGKTTTLKGVVYSMLRNNILPPIAAGETTKNLAAGKPGIVLVSFTNMAVRQVAKHFKGDIPCLTIHKLLEYAPEYYTVIDESGNLINKMQFAPSRNQGNPLPRALTTIVVDESSMVDCLLFQQLLDALPNRQAVQFVFLGDLNQLPPVYGGAILGKKLMELPIVELDTVYRQALLSPIIQFATNMKEGKLIPVGSNREVYDAGEHGKVTIHPWGKSLKWEDALVKAQSFCKAAIRDGALDPMTDIILCPYNVNFGVIELNLAIADYLGRERNAEVIEVVAGFNTHYYAVGDKLLVQKREALVTKIVRNPRYAGKRPVDTSKYKLDRYGGVTKRDDAATGSSSADFDSEDFDVDAFMDSLQITTVTERVTASSHHITVEFIGSEDEETGKREEMLLQSAAEVNEMLFAYAITVHKSQGSEWRRVFFITHSGHAAMCSRELMYTGMTRAREELYVICEPDRVAKSGTLSNAAKKPRLKGNTLAEKLVSLKAQFAKEAAEAQDKQGSLVLVEEKEVVED